MLEFGIHLKFYRPDEFRVGDAVDSGVKPHLNQSLLLSFLEVLRSTHIISFYVHFEVILERNLINSLRFEQSRSEVNIRLLFQIISYKDLRNVTFFFCFPGRF